MHNQLTLHTSSNFLSFVCDTRQIFPLNCDSVAIIIFSPSNKYSSPIGRKGSKEVAEREMYDGRKMTLICIALLLHECESRKKYFQHEIGIYIKLGFRAH